MSKEKFIPQIDTDKVSRSAQKERYSAYMKHFYMPEMKEKDDMESCNKTTGM